ncbi:MAG: hypothetical protein ED557_09120 [Balneola sp.]|nr:MAG: hypothetical protein ED557_09120 [Balneola sp.]
MIPLKTDTNLISCKLLILSSILLLSCSSGHKLTGTDYVDLSRTDSGVLSPYFPQQIADSLGWGDLSSAMLGKVKEEFRITLISEIEPFQLFRFSKGRRVQGESILYWVKGASSNELSHHENMKLYLKDRCTEFYETVSFGYCFPIYQTEPEWGKIYSVLDSRNIWTLPDQSEIPNVAAPESNEWVLNTQVRLGNYYRTYTHTTPGRYLSQMEQGNDLGMIIVEFQRLVQNQQVQDNFNTYSGITSGVNGSSFTLCNGSEVWRFNANLEDLLTSSGYPLQITQQEGMQFYITVSGTVSDEWYRSRSYSGYSRQITPTEVHGFEIVSGTTCPGL